MTNKLSIERIKQYATDPRMCNISDELRSGMVELLAYREVGSKPVAWRLLDQPEEVLTTTENNRVLSAWRKRGFDVQPLYASPVLGQTPINTELLEALKGLIAHASGGTKQCGHDFECICPFDAARSAIAKATGEAK